MGRDETHAPTWIDGITAVSPLLLGVAPFGLIFGVTAIAADVPPAAAWASSFIVFAGASQIAIVEVLGGGGAAIVALLTAVVINARHLMYSADMGRYTSPVPWFRRVPMAYLLTDQAYLTTTHRFPDPRSTEGLLPFYFGAALALWTTWQITTTAGMVLGAAVPESWSLDFAIPLTFMALLVHAIKDRPGVVAACVGAIVAVAAVGLPYSIGLLLGATAGVAAGMASERWFA
jgi:predicted branched-subunit amino acid permease